MYARVYTYTYTPITWTSTSFPCMFYTDYQAIFLFYDSVKDFFKSIIRGMVAKLVARLLIILSSQGSNPVIPQKL